jgi:hypothetical protein
VEEASASSRARRGQTAGGRKHRECSASVPSVGVSCTMTEVVGSSGWFAGGPNLAGARHAARASHHDFLFRAPCAIWERAAAHLDHGDAGNSSTACRGYFQGSGSILRDYEGYLLSCSEAANSATADGWHADLYVLWTCDRYALDLLSETRWSVLSHRFGCIL